MVQRGQLHVRASQPALSKTATLQAAAYADSAPAQPMSGTEYLVCRLETELELLRWHLYRSAWHASGSDA